MKKLLFVLWFMPLTLLAQENENLFFKWSTFGSAGLTVGQSGGKPIFQLSSGINYNRFFTGIGVGYDNYEFNTIPVFADWRWRFGKKESGFIYAIGGYNFPAKNKDIFEWAKISDKLNGGIYFDFGIGGGLAVSKSNRILFSAGFTRKAIRQQKIFVYPCFNNCDEELYRLKYSFGRLTAKLSWELGY